MLRIGREGFLKDLLIWFLASIIVASLLSAAGGALADRYFSRAVSGLIGEAGEYDLLFQVRSDLREAALSRLEEIIAENFPGSVLKTGVSVAGQSAIFVGLAQQYRTKEVFSNLRFYFQDIPGSSGYSLMTEPRLALSGVPGQVHDLFIREAERIPGVAFAFSEGGRIQVLFRHRRDEERVKKELEKLLKDYRLIEVGLAGEPAAEGRTGKGLVDFLAGKAGISYIRDVSTEEPGDQQALLATMAEMKRFLLSFAGHVKVEPEPGCWLDEGTLLVLPGKAGTPLEKGEPVKPGHVVIKLVKMEGKGETEGEGETERDGETEEELTGVVVQGDTTWIKDRQAFFVTSGQKVGDPAALVTPENPREELLAALEEAGSLLSQLHDLQNLSVQAEAVLTTAETIQTALTTVDSVFSGPEGKTARELAKLAHLFAGIGEELEIMANTLARLRYFERRLEEAVAGLEGLHLLVRLGIIPELPGISGDLGRKVSVLDGQMEQVVEKLRRHARALDDFINRFNPLVQTLMAWRERSLALSESLAVFNGLAGEDGAKLADLTAESLELFAQLDSSGLRAEVDALAGGLGGEKIDFGMVLEQLEAFKEALPKMEDEEIGRTLSLLDGYLGGEAASGETIRVFVNSGYNEAEARQAIEEYFAAGRVEMEVLPAGVIQPDIRGELTRLLQDIRGVVAALLVVIFGLLTLLLDQAPVMALFHHMELVVPLATGEKTKVKRFFYHRLLPRFYALTGSGLWFWLVYRLSGAHIPYLSGKDFLLAGALLGCGFFLAAEKFHRLNLEEIIAGCALGLSFTAIMREIVIPAGRPGLLQFLNRWKMVMK